MKKLALIVLTLMFLFGNVVGASALDSDKSSTMSIFPRIQLNVSVDNTSNSNVTYTATVLPLLYSNGSRILPIGAKIDFYTGSPTIAGYPTQYIGSAYTNWRGIAVLKLYQEPGKYKGGAVTVSTSWGKIYSNVVTYEVLKPVQPALKLEVRN
ncbi:MAG: hypothetical protein N2645_12110 [Clostridia bacterium]|nr:hypothetical protein [Clostridia bacterium]